MSRRLNHKLVKSMESLSPNKMFKLRDPNEGVLNLSMVRGVSEPGS